MSFQNLPPELLTNAEMGEADRLTIASGTPGYQLMENAGAAVAAEAARLSPKGGRIAVLCGPGNNGGDGFVAARLLKARGFSVTLGLLGPREALHGDAATAAAAWDGDVSALEALDLESADVAIDALFGAGIARDLDGAARDAVLRLNEWSARRRKPALAVDVPSGLDGTSGEIRGVAVRAARTITFFRRKPGHLLLPGRICCGETVVADIGIRAEALAAIAPKTAANGPQLWGRLLPFPSIEGHKYSRGHALVLSGSLAHTGAARLAARGALRAGAGLVTVATPRDALAVHAAALTAIMTTPCDGPEELAAILADRRKNALVLGPGLGVGAATRALVTTALAAATADPSPRAIVLDADALSSFKGAAAELGQAIRASGAPVVLTPHDGEFARLFDGASPDDADRYAGPRLQPEAACEALKNLRSGSKLTRARAAAVLTGAVVLLKGPDTVVADPDGRATIDDLSPPWLATAGSGDVLAGMIGGLCAQAMPPFEAASAAVWLHGAAARQFGVGLISEDLPESLPAVLRALYDSLGLGPL
ncbi:carbohydrate kinase, YjeF related protein [Methylocella silvestris BL2]|uniref:Bifunctional NAD(P)H-hydrate repair enzyme n=1 Tax=Methylocella silvestris (strain DSM 15510 / CIP 108128 / LMG 27833 / NCIMB 13906 / BL2) TaxID=395965 RepID=B8ET25_METSB|nr:bifunctional ADP-dependent NAD(P)H-hydrate dehydratase/NAD(P)H-hydrate epimerase [Methylocella silvestris]ACK51163.1 carbohydrate kinase, YjeF related protein [Methylocella silvestris BL2]